MERGRSFITGEDGLDGPGECMGQELGMGMVRGWGMRMGDRGTMGGARMTGATLAMGTAIAEMGMMAAMRTRT
jgi:hypothetical protein